MDTIHIHPKSSMGSKTEISASNFETEDIENVRVDSRFRTLSLVDNIKSALSVLALAAGLTIMGLSAHGVSVYHATHLPGDFLLPLWPADFDLRPTVALLVGSVIVILVNLLSVVMNKIKMVRNNSIINLLTLLSLPLIALIVSIVSISVFYSINASTTTDSFQSWTCRWKHVDMQIQPHFGTLCNQSQASVGLSVMLVPLEIIILGMAACQILLKRRT